MELGADLESEDGQKRHRDSSQNTENWALPHTGDIKGKLRSAME